MDIDAPNYEAAMPTADADLGPRLGRAKAILDVGAILGAIFFRKIPAGSAQNSARVTFRVVVGSHKGPAGPPPRGRQK